MMNEMAFLLHSGNERQMSDKNSFRPETSVVPVRFWNNFNFSSSPTTRLDHVLISELWKSLDDDDIFMLSVTCQ